ncbi:hypothetical protein MJO28_012137 [Puccinia striiformis f. sp. tritici]|uniref:Uncharacterized protein n=1 Tax=Puccinia striiformis f. sp. tritici TaxID=168172 RepID=A0ACC0E176_9BASI|nr:hypothetical protein MJO28_012137 [Puccinia striiformis f. sp. tritici]
MSLLENRLKDVHHHHHHHRPILKRSRTPYQTPEDSKRRRTSPTGAFSKLSLSPTTTSSTSNDNQSLTPPTTWLTHYSNQQLNSTGYHSVYEPITIESLSDNKTDSPSTSPELDGPSFQVSPGIARQLTELEKDQQSESTALFLNAHHYISSEPAAEPNDQQLVLYRKPVWSLPLSSEHDDDDGPQIVEIDENDQHVDSLDLHSNTDSQSDLMDID